MPAGIALAVVWFQPLPALEVAWFGPDGLIQQMQAELQDPRSIPAIIGPRGPAGPAGAHWNHSQTSPAAQWTINHNLGFRPAVTVLSPGGVEVEAEIIHASDNQTIIQFITPYAGTAHFS